MLLCFYTCKEHSKNNSENENSKVQYNTGFLQENRKESYFTYEKWISINKENDIYKNDKHTIQFKNYLDESKNEGGRKLYVNNKEVDFIITDAYVLTPYLFIDGVEKILLIKEEDEGGIYGFILYYFSNEKLLKKEYLDISPEVETEIDKFFKFKNDANTIQPIIITDKYYDTKIDKIKSAKEYNFVINKTSVEKNSKDINDKTNNLNNDSFSISGTWKAECKNNDKISDFLFYEKNQGYLSIYNKKKFLIKMMIEYSFDNQTIYYVGTNIIGDGIDAKNISMLKKGEIIGKIKIISENKISISWQGFNKEKLFMNNPFGSQKPTILLKCSE